MIEEDSVTRKMTPAVGIRFPVTQGRRTGVDWQIAGRGTQAWALTLTRDASADVPGFDVEIPMTLDGEEVIWEVAAASSGAPRSP